jgi:hypothetical protein
MGAANGGLNMAEIDMTAPTVAPVVGEYAKDRRGVACGPIKWSPLNGRFSFTDGVNKSWDESGRYCGRGHHKFDLIAIISAPDSVEPDAQRADPIAHLFEDVPASRRFVGGEVIPGILLLIPESKVVISVGKVLGTDVCKHITPADARNLAAAILAAADALETGESK